MRQSIGAPLRRGIEAAAVAVAMLAGAPFAAAQEAGAAGATAEPPERQAAAGTRSAADEDAEKRENPLRVEVRPYFFFPVGIDGTLGVGEVAGDVHTSIGDLYDEADVGALAGRIELWSAHRVGLIVDGQYSRIEYEGERGWERPLRAGTGSAALDQQLGQLDISAVVRPMDEKLESGARFTLDAMNGIRILWLRQTADVDVSLGGDGARGRDAGAAYDWAEMLFGLRPAIETGPVALVVEGTLGGFGIGAGSRLSWSALIFLRWRPASVISVDIGYRFQGMDYSRGGGDDRVVYDLTLNGPQLGISLFF